MRLASALALLLLGAVLGVGGAWLLTRADSSPGTQHARQAATGFLDRYVDPDGRVVRHDQGGDTVSEGQAYALLLALGAGDEERFERVWRWTRTHLQRPDGLLSYLWRDGRVEDPQPASDADLDAARALLLAAERFGVEAYRRDGARLARAVLAHETVRIGGASVLVAGPWARTGEAVINPSYFSPRAFAELGAALGEPAWGELRATSYALVHALTTRPPALPPDWARLSGSGEPAPTAPPNDPGRTPRYSFDALRVPIRMAEDTDGEGRTLAARSWPLLRASGALERELDGRALAPGEHPAVLAASAAAAHAAGEGAAAEDLLRRAEALDQRSPTYYGAVWVALTRAMLAPGLLGA